ncbi:TetR/AcrR family transcriptional regulator, partial [Streptomyces anulatus]
GGPVSGPAGPTLAWFAIDAYALAREADDPQGAVDEIFRMIEAAWGASRLA